MTFSRLKYSLARLGEQLWFWPAVYALLALCAIGISVASDEVPLPFDLPNISTETLRSLLNVLASTLLGVATFAVASMVAAYTSASTTATPRAFALVIADSMSRRALSVFIAGYIFSIIGLITVHVHTLGTTGHLVLFAMIIAVIGWVVLTFVAWVDSIARLGRLGDTISKLEGATLAAIRQWGPDGRMGTAAAIVPDTAHEVYAGLADPDSDSDIDSRIGHLQHVDLSGLQSWAERHDARVWLHAAPGSFVTIHRPLASVAFGPGSGLTPETAASAVRRSLVIGVDRSFTQDPRFGLICLSEIGSRALSPGINDPGTAIDVIRRHTRLFSVWAELRAESQNLHHDRLHLPPLDAETLMEDAFLGLERDGAALVEVGIWLQHAYASLAALPDTEIAAAARARSAEADRRCRETLSFGPDKERIARAASVVGELRLRS